MPLPHCTVSITRRCLSVRPLRIVAWALTSVVLLGPLGATGGQKKPASHGVTKTVAAAATRNVARTAATKPAKAAKRETSKHGKAHLAAAHGDKKRLQGKAGATLTVTKQKAGRRGQRRDAIAVGRAGRHATAAAPMVRSAPSVSYALRQPSPMRGFAPQMPRARLGAAWEEPPVPHLSFGQLAGLHGTPDALDLKSSVALVVDQDTNQVLLRKNDSAVLPIASLTKLMTGLIVSEAKLPLEQMITIEQEDVDTEKHSRSRLRVGTTLSRGELLHLALMSSENRAAHALGRTFPGGISRFVSLMNARAAMLGMHDTRYVEPTGLSSANQSSAVDLATLVGAAYNNALVRELSTSPSYELEVGDRLMQFNNTNRLVNNPQWDIGLQKTGYIQEAGQCLVMQAKIAGRKLIMVFLDSAGKLSRIGDAERVRRWIESTHPGFPSLRGAVPSISG